MKNNRNLFGLIAVAIVAMLALAACGNKDSGDPSSPPGSKTVEARYWFSGGSWYDDSTGTMITEAVSKLDENSISVQGGGVILSYTGVYTEGGGTVNTYPWAYVYAGSVKIGLVIDGGSFGIQLAIGKTYCDGMTTVFTESEQTVDFTDMQNIINGEADSP